jgi:transposase
MRGPAPAGCDKLPNGNALKGCRKEPAVSKHNTTEKSESKVTKTTIGEIQKQASQERLTIGLDLGDRNSHFCVVNEQGRVVMQDKLGTTKTGLNRLFEKLAKVRVALEAGTHSPWVSRHLSSLGHEVIVANPRRLAIISDSKRKNDRIDAEKLARLARMDPELLSPIHHRSEQAQKDLAQIRVRESLVEARTGFVNEARGQAKALGTRLEDCDADHVGTDMTKQLPEDVRAILNPLLELASQMTAKIKEADQTIHTIAKRYGEIQLLTAIWGVGELTALAFVLTIEEKERFDKSRQVGPYLGMVPGQSQSGNSDPQQRITKEGDRLVRWLLVQCAHCILRQGAPDSDLRRWGLNKIDEMKNGKGKPRKKKVIVAVARKLAVVMHRLWVHGEVYDPLYNAKKQEALAKRKSAA